MKCAHPDESKAGAAVEGGAILAGILPARKHTVTAEVLMRFLGGEHLTSLDGVFGASTTRLSAVVHYLLTRYEWPIEKTDKAAGCKDGRVAWVAEYSLHRDAISHAMRTGAASWCEEVRIARRKLRKDAPRARATAERMNSYPRRARPMWAQPGQGSLFEGAQA